MAEGSDALLDRLDRVMKDEFDAKMLGRVGRGHFAIVKFFNRTLRWARPVAWIYRLSICDEDTNSGHECNWRRRSRCPGAAGYFSGSNLTLSGGLVGHIVLDRLDCQYAAKAVRLAGSLLGNGETVCRVSV